MVTPVARSAKGRGTPIFDRISWSGIAAAAAMVKLRVVDADVYGTSHVVSGTMAGTQWGSRKAVEWGTIQHGTPHLPQTQVRR
jgi:hypothetical protein